MPEVILRHKLYRTFGSRSEYRAAPMWEVVEERLRILAEHTVNARQNEETQDRIAEQEAEAERMRYGGR